ALKHPTWKLGRKITIGSATLANKGLEVIEASFLFDFPPENIEVTVHRQSVVHSMIRTQEGSVYAQMSPPDMSLPIMAAVSDTKLDLHNVVRPLSFKNLTLTFEEPNTERFPMLKHAYRVLSIGGSAPIAFNASDEVAVAAFIDGKIGFDDIAHIVGTTIEDPRFKTVSSSYEEIKEMDRLARTIAEGLI
ncbi:MAG: 1-deoxy-D-xylulose-5-phosphate reductoisomerase, partial [Spirochaetales bacterium]|nr:1-deoxy-D-xylulose-5-phosphate reductoisomerase [Candidatus Physcosoma equi]